MKKTIFFGLIWIFCFTANGQLLDKYGLRIGAGLSNQYWEYNLYFMHNMTGWKKSKVGFTIYIFGEKNINKFLSIRPEIGYVQKGFKDDTYVNFERFNENVILHDLSTNIGFKIAPLDYTFKPYIIAGIHGDYMISYQDIEAVIQGQRFSLYKFNIDDFSKFSLSGLIGVGFEYKDFIYMDFEFNPAIKKQKALDADVKNRYYGITIGLNIKSFIKNQ